MDTRKFIEICKQKVGEYYTDGSLNPDVFVVWSCKTLQNNKALLSTNAFDGRYFEITYNGDKDEFYFDCYLKEKNYKFEVK